MLPSPAQFNGLNSIAQLDLSDLCFTPKPDMSWTLCHLRYVPIAGIDHRRVLHAGLELRLGAEWELEINQQIKPVMTKSIATHHLKLSAARAVVTLCSKLLR